MSAIITPQSFLELLQKQTQITLVDVRSPTEFSKWSLYDSVNIPLADIERKASKLPKSHPVILYCDHGNISHAAAKLLEKKGFDAHSLEGGLQVWNSIYDIATVLDKRSTLTIHQVKRLGKGCLSYLVVLPDKMSTIIIDPTTHTDVYKTYIKANNLKPIAVLDTHIHADHVSGGRKLSKAYRIPYLLSKDSKTNFAFEIMEKILPKLVKDATVTIIPTPGHTPESVALLLDDTFLISGDTLFIDAIGRADLGGDQTERMKQFYTSLTTLMKLPENIQVLPAHTAQSMMPGSARSANMRYITLFNPLKDMRSQEAFVEFQLANIAPFPANYEHIQRINMGKKPLPSKVDEIEFGPNSCALNIPEEE